VLDEDYLILSTSIRKGARMDVGDAAEAVTAPPIELATGTEAELEEGSGACVVAMDTRTRRARHHRAASALVRPPNGAAGRTCMRSAPGFTTRGDLGHFEQSSGQRRPRTGTLPPEAAVAAVDLLCRCVQVALRTGSRATISDIAPSTLHFIRRLARCRNFRLAGGSQLNAQNIDRKWQCDDALLAAHSE